MITPSKQSLLCSWLNKPRSISPLLNLLINRDFSLEERFKEECVNVNPPEAMKREL
jgi:hypothetical protein